MSMSEKDLNKPLRDFIVPVRTTIYVEHTVEEALRYLRDKHITDEIIYIYVVDGRRIEHYWNLWIYQLLNSNLTFS